MGKKNSELTQLVAGITAGKPEDLDLLKCREHPAYSAKQAPRRTAKHPKGCLACWGYFKAMALVQEDYEHLYLKAAREGGVGRLRAFESPRDLAEMGLQYLEWCIRNDKHPTKSGFAVFCGVCIETVASYRRGEKDDADVVGASFSAVVKKLDSCFIAKQEQRLLDARTAATNLIAWMNNNANWASSERKQIDLGIDIRVIDYSGGTTFDGKPRQIAGLDASRSGDPPDAGIVDADAERIDSD